MSTVAFVFIVWCGILALVWVTIKHGVRHKPAPVSGRIVKIDYTNWRGDRRTRIIDPVALVFKKSEWHEEPQWFIEAFDCERRDAMDEPRDFALANIHAWLDPEPTTK